MAEVNDATLNQLRGKAVEIRIRTADPRRPWVMNAELASHDATWVQLRNPRAGQRTFPIRRDMIESIDASESAAGARA